MTDLLAVDTNRTCRSLTASCSTRSCSESRSLNCRTIYRQLLPSRTISISASPVSMSAVVAWDMAVSSVAYCWHTTCSTSGPCPLHGCATASTCGGGCLRASSTEAAATTRSTTCTSCRPRSVSAWKAIKRWQPLSVFALHPSVRPSCWWMSRRGRSTSAASSF